jgi:decaprenylphospho-beta-D-erythro-pentofuranosid-2-ulose 2-reductase
VIGSVAGDRGRAGNYIYGAAKSAVETYLSGLRNRLASSGVSVITIKPGLVDTPMTAHLPKTALVASASDVARAIDRAIQRHRLVVYVPWFWRWIMLTIRMLPERLFMRMRIG